MSVIFQQARIINPLEHVDSTGTLKVDDNGIIEAVVYGSQTLAQSPGDRVIDLRRLLSPEMPVSVN